MKVEIEDAHEIGVIHPRQQSSLGKEMIPVRGFLHGFLAPLDDDLLVQRGMQGAIHHPLPSLGKNAENGIFPDRLERRGLGG